MRNENEDIYHFVCTIELRNDLLKGVRTRWFKTNNYKDVNNISGGRISGKFYQLPAQALVLSPTLRLDQLHILPTGGIQVYMLTMPLSSSSSSSSSSL
jgi:hypothetical protein